MKNKINSLVISLIITSMLLSSCSAHIGKLSETSGVGRESAPIETAAPETEPEPVTPESSWALSDGKYSYNLPKRDDSGLATVNEMSSTPKTAFDDQPDDWYFGKTTYDETTGEVTYTWDRSASTVSTLKNYNSIYRGDETRKVVYLTFDCGFEYGATEKILDTLRDKNAPGTFFLTGHYVKTEHDLIARMLDEGHIVGNHTVNHKIMTELSVNDFIEELEGLEKLFYEDFPEAQPMLYFRPPQGRCNEWLLKLANKMGYHTVMWSWAYYDYDVDNQPDVAESLAKAKNGLHPGAVYLLHAESMTNAEMLGDFIDFVRAQGYEILPLCDINYPAE